MKDKKKLIAALLALLVVAAVIFYVIRGGSAHAGAIRLSGNIEVTDAEVSFKIPGRVVARLVDEGEIVKTGQLVARLESAELAQEVALR